MLRKISLFLLLALGVSATSGANLKPTRNDKYFFHSEPAKQSQFLNVIQFLEQDEKGRLIYGNLNSDITIDNGIVKKVTFIPGKPNIRSIINNEYYGILFATDNGLWKFNDHDQLVPFCSNKLLFICGSQKISKIEVTNEGLYVAYDKQLIFISHDFNVQKKVKFDLEEFPLVSIIKKSQTDDIFISTDDQGVFMIPAGSDQAKRLNFYSEFTSKNYDNQSPVTSTMVSYDKKLFIANIHGLFELNIANKSVRNISKNIISGIISYLKVIDNAVWIMMRGHYDEVFHYDLKTSTLSALYNFPNESSNKPFSFRDVIKTSENVYWLATLHRGLLKSHDSLLSFYRVTPRKKGLSHKTRTLYTVESENASSIVSTNNGIYKLNEESLVSEKLKYDNMDLPIYIPINKNKGMISSKNIIKVLEGENTITYDVAEILPKNVKVWRFQVLDKKEVFFYIPYKGIYKLGSPSINIVGEQFKNDLSTFSNFVIKNNRIYFVSPSLLFVFDLESKSVLYKVKSSEIDKELYFRDIRLLNDKLIVYTSKKPFLFSEENFSRNTLHQFVLVK